MKVQLCVILSVVCVFICEARIHPKCSKCPPGWGAIAKCTTTTNTNCMRCTKGKFYSSIYSSKSPCLSCSKCGVGLFESHECTPIKDTICSECVSYVDHKNYTMNESFLKNCGYLFLK